MPLLWSREYSKPLRCISNSGDLLQYAGAMKRRRKQYVIIGTLLTTGERKRVSVPANKEKTEEWAEKLRFYVRWPSRNTGSTIKLVQSAIMKMIYAVMVCSAMESEKIELRAAEEICKG